MPRDFQLANVAQSLYGQPWAILPEKLAELVAVFERRRAGLVVALDDDGKGEGEPGPRPLTPGAKLREVAGVHVEQIGRVAVLPLFGTITQRPGVFTRYSGGTSAEQFAAAHDELTRDDGVKSIVWDVDSPGGSVAGVPESAARLMELRGRKRTVAVSNTVMASAAYWLASAADEVVAAPSSLTGSIGVYTVHEDHSRRNESRGVSVSYISAGKYKTEGNYDGPLTDEARAAEQQMVDDFYDQFVRSVAKARGATPAAVRDGYGEGRVLTAERARGAGLVDRVATLGSVLRKLGAYDPTPDNRGRTAAARQRQAEAI